jgi:hypothetical protein
VLFAAGRARVVALIAVAGALTQVVLLIPLVLVLDATGAALSFLGSMALANFVTTVIALRMLAQGDQVGAPGRDSSTLGLDAAVAEGVDRASLP